MKAMMLLPRLYRHLFGATYRSRRPFVSSTFTASFNHQEESSFKNKNGRPLVFAASALTTTAILLTTCSSTTKNEEEETTLLLNWSGTHAIEIQNSRFWEPESIQEVERIVQRCQERGQTLRPLGSALSPNAIAFADGMISMANLDQILEIDTNSKTVTVQAGARCQQVVDALRRHNLTLPNLASIAEQQMGGLVQVGAHGTGKAIAPLDHYVTKLKIVTPSQGTIELTKNDDDDELFEFAKVGLGCLGIVVEITMECIPAHYLREQTMVLTRQEAQDKLDELLRDHKHMRYMWIPYTDAVVCVTNDPVDTNKRSEKREFSEAERFQPLTDLLMKVTHDFPEPFTAESVKGMGFGELRDATLAVDPLNIEHVKMCNAAEAEFWRRSQGYTIKPSDELLQFDCGGQQWVWEICFPTGTQHENNGNDMKFMQDLLEGIEKGGIPAHSPIEQRWSASSSSKMSPAHGEPNGLHSWVGIINYLPSENEGQRREITQLFTGTYCDLMRNVGSKVNATSHWAKLERPTSVWKLIDLQLFLAERFPVTRFNELRGIYDPKNILANPLINLVLGTPPTQS